MSNGQASALEAQESFDVKKEKVDMLHGKAVGLVGVLFLCVTGAAPMSAMLGNVPFGASAGNGLFMPGAFLLATIVLTIFSIGYAAMASRVSSVGGFYSYISLGLGRDVGMAAGMASFLSYSVFEASLYGLFAYFANSWLLSHFGINVSWIWLALFCVVLAGLFSHFDVQLSAKILGVALILELVMLSIFNFGVLMSPTANFDLAALNPLSAFTSLAETKSTWNGEEVTIAAGVAAVGIFMAFWSWVGFEMAPNYAEESVDPKRIIPRSLYYSVIGLGLFYILTSWCAVSAYPTEAEMVAKASKDSSNFFLTPLEQNVGKWASELMYFLILTSSFACGMAFHNTASRYAYSLGREGVFLRFLGKTHPTHKSPYTASMTQSALAAIWLGLFAYFMGTDDPTAQAYVAVYTMLAILGTMLLLILQAIVSIAIIVYFRQNHPGEVNVIAGLIAPLISFVAQAYLVYLLVTNLATFGGAGAFGSNIPWIALAIVVWGFVWGLVLRVAAPETHAKIGRIVYNDA